MNNEERIIELLAEMVKGQDQNNNWLDQNNKRLESLEKTTERSFDKLEEQVVKLTAQTVENTRAIMKLADKMDDFAEHEKRIQKLEKVVFKGE